MIDNLCLVNSAEVKKRAMVHKQHNLYWCFWVYKITNFLSADRHCCCCACDWNVGSSKGSGVSEGALPPVAEQGSLPRQQRIREDSADPEGVGCTSALVHSFAFLYPVCLSGQSYTVTRPVIIF